MSWATNGSVRIHYETQGDGPALVLGHGFSDGIEGWKESGWLPELALRFQTILIDLRGHGRSDKPHDPQAYGTAERAGDVVAVLNALGIDRAHYLGVSLGGFVGLCLAAHAPERLSSLAAGGAPIFGQSMQAYRHLIAAGLATWKTILERSLGNLSPEREKRVLENDCAALAASVAHDRPAMDAALRAAELPVLFFAGAKDPLKDAIAAGAKALPRARFVELPEVDHVQMCVRPAILPAFLGFVASLDARGAA